MSSGKRNLQIDRGNGKTFGALFCGCGAGLVYRCRRRNILKNRIMSATTIEGGEGRQPEMEKSRKVGVAVKWFARFSIMVRPAGNCQRSTPG